MKSKHLFVRLKIESSFFQESLSSWEENAAFIQGKGKVLALKAVNDIAERSVRLVQDFRRLITAEEEQKLPITLCARA